MTENPRHSGPVEVGDLAPDFTLPAADGATVSLHDMLGSGTIVLYFYPKDDSAGCTAQACSFRDNYEDFREAGAEVVGISADASSRHEQFAAKHRLPFTLLSDVDGSVRKAYGATTAFGLLPGRVTYVIDSAGVVRYSFSSQLRVRHHVQEALKVVRSLEATPLHT